MRFHLTNKLLSQDKTVEELIKPSNGFEDAALPLLLALAVMVDVATTVIVDVVMAPFRLIRKGWR